MTFVPVASIRKTSMSLWHVLFGLLDSSAKGWSHCMASVMRWPGWRVTACMLSTRGAGVEIEGGAHSVNKRGLLERALVGLRPLVAGGGEIRDAALDDAVHRLGDDAVLEPGLVGVGGVVHDDVGAGVGQLQDVQCEVALRRRWRWRTRWRARGGVVDDLGHGAALVGAAGPILHDLHAGGGQVAAVDVVLGCRGRWCRSCRR